MPSTRRKILFYIFILAFLVITPLTILYAQGYRIQLSWPPKWDQALQKTGMLSLETAPAGAKVYIDGEPQTSLADKFFSDPENSHIRTPAQIKYLLPGEYQVTLEKDGYWEWEKRMEVKPGKQTKAENITLFKKNLPLQIVGGSIQEFKLSPNKKWSLLNKEKKLVDLDTGGIQKLSVPEQAEGIKSKEMKWGPQGNYFLLGSYLYKTEDLGPPFDLAQENKKIKNIRWKDATTIHYQEGGELKRIDPATKKTEKILTIDKRTTAQMMDNNYIHTITLAEDNSFYRLYSLNSKEKIREIKLPRSPGYDFLHSDHHLINIHDSDYNTLYLLNIHSLVDPVKHIIKDVKYTDWKNEQELLYANEFEIWTYDLDQKEKTLLTRISDPITGVNTYPDGDYILYYTDHDINVLENGDKEKRRTTTLMELQRITSPRFDKENNVVYFNAEVGRKKGLYKLKI